MGETIILKNCKMFNGHEKELKEKVVLLIKDCRISYINENYSEEDVLQLKEKHFDAQVYNLEGKTIMPGLIDCHIHLDLYGMPDTFKENFVNHQLRAIRAAHAMEETLMSGFTTVRNAGSINWIDITVKEAIEEKLVKGPRILTCGNILSITASGTDYFFDLYREADGYDGFKKAAREQLKMGVDLLKIMATGAIMNPGSIPGATQPDINELNAVVEEAKKIDKCVAAHAHGNEGIKNAIKAGVDTIEHGTFADEEAHEMMIEAGVYLIPTLAPDYLMHMYGKKGGVAEFMVEKLKKKREARLEALERALKLGVKVAIGSDAGTPYNFHKNNARELTIMVEEGLMSPGEVLVSATKVSSEACDLDEDIGTIEVGKYADLLVVEGNPLEDIELITDKSNIKMVIKEGDIVKEEEGLM